MHSARGKWEETFQPTRLLKPWGKAPLKRDICRNREGFGPAYRGWNTDYYNFDPIVTNLKANKGGPCEGRGERPPPSFLGFYEPLNRGENTVLNYF